jgi:hypothetical protein
VVRDVQVRQGLWQGAHAPVSSSRYLGPSKGNRKARGDIQQDKHSTELEPLHKSWYHQGAARIWQQRSKGKDDGAKQYKRHPKPEALTTSPPSTTYET